MEKAVRNGRKVMVITMSEQHPIQGLMYTSMQSIKEMIDVNTIVGDPVQTPDGTVIIPISKVGLGFAVGGSEFKSGTSKAPSPEGNNMFGGGSGGGVSITPVAFMVVGNGQIRLLPATPENTVYDRVLDMIPTAIDKLSESIKEGKEKRAAKKAAQSADDLSAFDDLQADTPAAGAQVDVSQVEPPILTDMDSE